MEQSEGYLVPAERIEKAIFTIRGDRVMLDADLAAIYGVTTRRLLEQVKRNSDRFPPDFVFQLTEAEWLSLRSQNATSKAEPGRGGRRYRPYAFTEHGAVMLACVLRTPRAVEVSVFVVKAFTRMRRMLADQREFALKLAELESRLASHDNNFQVVFDALRKLMHTPEPKKRRIGFITTDRHGEAGSDFIARDRPRRSRSR